jgi:hypothetical protein
MDGSIHGSSVSARTATPAPQRQAAPCSQDRCSARYPRLLAWPLAALGGLYGGLGLVRAVRSRKSKRLSAIPSGAV